MILDVFASRATKEFYLLIPFPRFRLLESREVADKNPLKYFILASSFFLVAPRRYV